MEPNDFNNILKECLLSTMADPSLPKALSTLSPLSTHAHNSPKELERFFLEKICNLCTKHLIAYFSGSRKLFLLPITNKEHPNGMKGVLYLRKDPPVAVGSLFLQIVPEQGELFVEFHLNITSWQEETFSVPLCPVLKGLSAPHNPQPLPRLDPDTHHLVFIDLEWVSCFKTTFEDKQVDPGQISEFSFLTENDFYTSGYLRVNESYLKRVHKKLLEKMGISPEIIYERHKYGVTFLEEWNRVLIPMMEQMEEENKTLVLLSFGTEDGKIFRKLFPPNHPVKLVDVSGYFHIFHFGQMALLNGMGVTFTHDFSSAMDVRALFLIYEVFSTCETVEDSRNLQLALQLNKMYQQCLSPIDQEKLRIYLSLLEENPKTKAAFDLAISMAQEMVEADFFCKREY
ncbi:MAG: hypothetical protein R3Y63_10570 [Eubacteriales bacterium]